MFIYQEEATLGPAGPRTSGNLHISAPVALTWLMGPRGPAVGLGSPKMGETGGSSEKRHQESPGPSPRSPQPQIGCG